MKLPNCHEAVIDLAKLRDYSLNSAHELGSNKARVFLTVLGLGREDAELLRQRLLAVACEADVIPGSYFTLRR